MLFGGLQKFSLIDYPGKTCAVVFTVGCNFRCPYCHNPELVSLGEDTNILEEQEILEFLEKRKDKLDAVVITGGEPTLHKDLLEFIKKLKNMGFLVKLDSNGTCPDLLQKALEEKLVDYIAMDIKAPLDKYEKVAIVPVNIEDIKKSIEILKNSEIDYEFRTTVVESMLSKKDILEIGDTISGAKRYYLQKFVPTKVNDEAYLKETTYSDEEFEELRAKIAPKVKICGVR